MVVSTSQQSVVCNGYHQDIQNDQLQAHRHGCTLVEEPAMGASQKAVGGPLDAVCKMWGRCWK